MCTPVENHWSNQTDKKKEKRRYDNPAKKLRMENNITDLKEEKSTLLNEHIVSGKI